MSDLSDFDPLTPDDPKQYSVDKFYTKADRDKLTERYQVRVSSEMARQLSVLFHSKEIPQYETPSDILRDALVHRLKHVGDMIKQGKLKDVVNHEIQEAEALSLMAELEGRRKGVQVMEDLTREARSSDDIPFLQSTIEALNRRIATSYGSYRAEYEKMLGQLEKTMEMRGYSGNGSQ